MKELDSHLKKFLNDALRQIMSVVGANCGSLFLCDPENKELILDQFYNSNELYFKGLKQRVGEGVSGKVAELKEPVLVSNIDQDSRFKQNGFKHYHTKSFISIPLFGAKELLGIINIADKSNGEPFSRQDLEFAVNLANYACIIVEHLLHFTKLELEKNTLDKQKTALEKYATVGKLAAGVVHEINNPLDGVIRYTNMLLGQVENNSVAKEYLLEMKKGLNRIANITKSLLEFSHQANSRSCQPKEYVDVRKLVNESLEFLSGRFNNGAVRVNTKYLESLPRVSDFGLQQVFTNIIKNALDVMPEGGALEITTEMKDSWLEIIFKDTGSGMPSEIKDRIFEPFFTTKSIDKGTGLGLSISKEIINKYEGRIEVESSPGVGSNFTVIIPKKYLENV
ncbi:MAG: ATP-binding protein [Candidatus Omnitrophica bacterium]|nr:ATP-binding protein [Candidatus Omnitrophota bacterium]